MGRISSVIGSILLLVIAFVAVNMIAGASLRGARIDATQGSLYTLTAGSKAIAKSPDEPIKLTLYYSAKLATGNAQLQAYAQRVRELLEEYARVSAGKIRLSIVDPEPFTEAEDEATMAGIAPVPLDAGGENLFFGLVGSNAADGKELIPFFDPRDERLLEYNVSKLIHSLANPKKKVVGLLAGLSIEGGFAMDPMTRQPRQTKPWRVAAELKQSFETRTLAKDLKEIPADVDLLLLVHPKGLSDQTLYAIDQFVMRGGKAVVYVDPNCDNDPEGGNPMSGGGGSKASDLNKLLNAWGVDVPAGKFVADAELAITVSAGRGQETMEAIQLLGVRAANLNNEDPITSGLARMNFGTSGVIVPFKAAAKPDAKPDGKTEGKDAPAAPASPMATITPLVQTSTKAMVMDTSLLMFPDPSGLRKAYTPGSEKQTIAARIAGSVKSAFAAGRPTAEGESAEDAAKYGKNHLAASSGSINLVLVADVDCLANMFWVREQEILPGMPVAQKFADNGDMFLNAVDNMCGSTDLLSVRARQESARPFTLVEDMQKRANEKYRAEQALLEKELEVTQQKLNELQGKKQGQDAFVLTPEQQKEVEKFRAQSVETRKKLRGVKSSLRKDIETLGTQLKFINIGLLPILVTLGAVGLGFFRVSRRRVKSAD
jgi:ABC-type uncharacterized transport system involved in gliding motility auxiliary subunit